MKRNPHPARRSRIATLGISTTAFVSVITSLTWNTNQAELAANIVDATAVPVQQVTPVADGSTAPTEPVTSNPANPATPAATIAPTAPAAPAKKSSAPAPAKKKTTTAPATPAGQTAAPATPVVAPAAPAAPAAAPAVAPAAPAPTVVYTCMSPGGKTENPTSTGKCKNAKYGYVLTQI